MGRMLRLAARGWRGTYVLSALPTHRGDVGHVVVGTTGIFAIETRAYTGTVRVNNGALVCGGSSADRSAFQDARRAAAAVRELLTEEAGETDLVQPVLCLPFADLERPEYAGGVIVARPGQLDFLIRHWRGQVISEATALRAFATLRAHATRRAAA